MNLINVIAEALRHATGNDPQSVSMGAGFKALGNKWFAWWSNAFEDYDGEYFSEKAIDEYVMRVDSGVVPMPELWLWHTPGTKHGAAEWVGRIGHFAVAAGSFDETPAGKAAQAFFAKAKGDYGMSHGFVFDPGQKSDGVFHQFNTFEISVLPREKAANPYTAFEEVFDMEMSDEKRAFLAQVLGGEEVADQLIVATEARSKAMDALDVRYKDFVSMDATATKEDLIDDEQPPAEEAPMAEARPSAMGEFVVSITEDVSALAEAVNILIGKLEAVQSEDMAEKARHQQSEAALRADIKALREAFDLRPRSAAADAATEIEKSALTDAIKAQIEEDDYETVLGLRVRKTS